jgi:hypothetical protein
MYRVLVRAHARLTRAVHDFLTPGPSARRASPGRHHGSPASLPQGLSLVSTRPLLTWRCISNERMPGEITCRACKAHTLDH